MARSTGPKSTASKSTKPAATPAASESVTEATEAPTTTEAEKEAPVTSTVTETPDTTEATDSTTEATATEATPEFDLTAFKAAVDAALAERDSATGTLAEAPIESVKAAYRDLDGAKAKNAAKKHLTDFLQNAIDEMDIVLGKATMILSKAVQNAGSASKGAPPTPTDPTEAFVQRLTVLNLAYNLVATDVPEGVDEEAARAKVTEAVEANDEAARTYLEWASKPEADRGDEPEVSALVKKAVKVAMGKGVGSVKAGGTAHEGPRGNVARHIQLAFADQPLDTFMKVSEIAKAKTEEYPNGNASPGAVSSRLKSSTAIEGIEAGENADKRFGAYKRA